MSGAVEIHCEGSANHLFLLSVSGGGVCSCSHGFGLADVMNPGIAKTFLDLSGSHYPGNMDLSGSHHSGNID
jgi:hypothetical protein